MIGSSKRTQNAVTFWLSRTTFATVSEMSMARRFFAASTRCCGAVKNGSSAATVSKVWRKVAAPSRMAKSGAASRRRLASVRERAGLCCAVSVRLSIDTNALQNAEIPSTDHHFRSIVFRLLLTLTLH